MDSQLVSMVRDLEQQAERMLQEATLKAEEEKSAEAGAVAAKIQQVKDEAIREAERIQSEAAAELEKDLAKAQEQFRLRMDEKLQQAKAKMKESVQFILHRLAGK